LAPTAKCTPEEAAAPLLDAILTGGETLPAELQGLRDYIQSDITTQQVPISNGSAQNGSAPANKVERRNIWNEEKLDVSKLRIKDDDDV
jgi:activating signal cointegrator complex subunit 2